MRGRWIGGASAVWLFCQASCWGVGAHDKTAPTVVACASEFGALVPGNIRFVRTAFRTAVPEQFADYCVDMSTMGHLESLFRQELSTDWLTLKILEKDFYQALTRSLNYPPKQTFRQLLAAHGAPPEEALQKQFVHGDVFGHRGYTLIEQVGVVDKKDFAFSPEFIAKTQRYEKELGLTSSRPIPPLLSLTRAMENVLAQLEHAQLTESDPKKLAAKMEAITRGVRSALDLGLAGFKGDYSPTDHLGSLAQKAYPGGFKMIDTQGLGFHERVFGVTVDRGYPDPGKLRDTIRATIDRGYNLHVAYSHDPRFVDEKTGRIELPADFDRARFRAENGGFIGNRHAALIEGYHLDEKGNIDWVLVKNSGGDEIFASGYNEMSFPYLVEMGFLVTHHRLPEPSP